MFSKISMTVRDTLAVRSPRPFSAARPDLSAHGGGLELVADPPAPPLLLLVLLLALLLLPSVPVRFAPAPY
jgi:hypothetical protein